MKVSSKNFKLVCNFAVSEFFCQSQDSESLLIVFLVLLEVLEKVERFAHGLVCVLLIWVVVVFTGFLLSHLDTLHYYAIGVLSS